MSNILWLPKSWIGGIDSPDDIDPTVHIGKKFKVLDDNKKEVTIVCEEVLGSLRYPARFQVNAKGASYLISMLDFFGQANGHFFTKDEIAEFEKAFQDVKVRANAGWQPSWMRKKIWTPR